MHKRVPDTLLKIKLRKCIKECLTPLFLPLYLAPYLALLCPVWKHKRVPDTLFVTPFLLYRLFLWGAEWLRISL